MSESRSVLIGALMVSAWACTGGTETGNPLTDFDISRCKDLAGEDQASGAQRSALTARSPRYDGLACFIAQRDGDRVELDVRNFAGGCGVSWDAAARVSGAKLDVVLTNPSCVVARCGGCSYDARFTVELPEGARDDEEIALIDQPCEGEAREEGAWRVPAEDDGRTVACDFSLGADSLAGMTGTCGQENMPCRKSGSDSLCEDAATDCDEGLTCTEIDEYGSRCLKACTTADDCAVPAAMRCEDGLCVL